MSDTSRTNVRALPGIRHVRYLDGGAGRHAEVTGRSGTVHEVMVYPIPTELSFFGIPLHRGWNWLVDGELARELGRPMSLDDAWSRAIRRVVSLDSTH